MKKIFKTLFLLTATLGFGLTSCNGNGGKTVDPKSMVESITLDRENIELEVGGSTALNAAIKYKDDNDYNVAINWTTSDPNVATVSESGFITAIGSGKGYISAIAGYKMVSCSIHVLGDDPGPGPGPGPQPGEFTITLNETSIELYVTETTTLYARTSEPATVIWSSTKEDVAMVDDKGNITAIDVGECDIIAAANNKSAVCHVSVVEPEDLYDCTIYFFIDYNNIDENDKTGTKLLAKFRWFTDQPIGLSGKVPADPTQPMDPAFPYFIGWSAHTIIDTKDDLWDMDNDLVGSSPYIFLYGIWAEVPKGEFVR